LLFNVGSPEGTGYWAVRRYLSTFLSDRRVIERDPLLWQPILQGLVLNTRPRKTAKAYRAIWRDDADGSPLRYFTRRQAELLDRQLAAEGVIVDWAMRYGKPSIPDRLEALRARGCGRILIFPLYPQYSATTTASVMDHVHAALRGMRRQPSIRSVPSFCDHTFYIEALAASIRNRRRKLDWEPELTVLSFHGLPQSYIDRGDPYHSQCERTATALRAALGMSSRKMVMSFQSRFGRQPWLQPGTAETVVGSPRQGVRKVMVVTPGFVADCVETLEEVAIGIRAAFLDAGGSHFDHVPGLNDSPAAAWLLATLVRRELAGWLDAPIGIRKH
jgi:ferrochelatase